MDLTEETINKILSLGKTVEVESSGRKYQNGPKGFIPILPPIAETIAINTLTGIIDFVPSDNTMIHVVNHKEVRLIGKDFDNENWLTRSTFLTALHESPVFRFGQFYSVEDFIISLQSMFVQDETTALILKLVGNVKDEGVSNYCDDGVTQQVKAKTGISLVSDVPVPNPVTLRPYRTFMEIEQPASTFVFRMQGGKGQTPSCALFEADGRMWRLTAIQSIKSWLKEKLPEIKIIA
ncbi:MAG: hypothetical protein PHW03_05345 [Eubacteriales bacterium]|nr:hypothetical protein [Eubacteriales bacterium]